MKFTTRLKIVMLVLACVGMLLPAPVLADVTAPSKTSKVARQPVIKAFDVELHKGGTFVGQVVNAQGVPQVKMPVSLIRGNKTIVTTSTNKGGFFAVSRVPSGTYRAVAGKTQGVYRIWAKGTAPPKSQPGALLVVGQGPVRAQSGPIGYWLGNPWVIAGLVAAAVAIPVAIHNHQIDNDDPVSP